MKLFQKLSLGLLVSSLLVIFYIQPAFADTIFNLAAAVNPNNTLTLSNLSDKELLEHLKKTNDWSEIADSGIYIREFGTRYADSFFDDTIGPNGYQAYFSNSDVKFVNSPLYGFGYFPYSSDEKLVRVYDDELSEWMVQNQSFRAYFFELEEGEHITDRREQDGILYLSTELAYRGSFDDNFEEAGVKLIPQGTPIYFVYTFDIASGKLLTSQAFLKEAGQFVIACNRILEYHTEQPHADDVVALHEDICGGNTHTIGIIVGQGTKREKVYVFTANESAFLDPWIRDKDCTYNCYLDPDFTIECPTSESGHIPFDSNKVIYMK